MAVVPHALLGQHSRAAGDGAHLLRDQGRDVTAPNALGDETCRHLRELCPATRNAGHVRGLVDLIPEQDDTLGAQAQQIAGRQRAGNAASLVGDAEMANLEAPHAGDGKMSEGVGGNAGKRVARYSAGRQLHRRSAIGGEASQHVAFGDDPGFFRPRHLGCFR